MKERDFVTFIDKNQAIIHKVCRIYTNDEEDYKDLFQEIMLQLWQSINKYEGKAKLTTWMYRVSLFTAITRLKKQQKVQYVSDENIKETKDNDIAKQENEQQLLQAIKQLNQSEKALIMLYLDEKNYKEMSAIMGISESNVGVRLNRIKAKLKKIISREL